MTQSSTCPLPRSSHLGKSLCRIDYCETYEVPAIRRDQSLVSTYAAALDHLPNIFKRLLVLRSILVKPFGIAGTSNVDLTKPIDTDGTYAVGDKIGRWTIYDQRDDELITGANGKHLDFRVSVLREDQRRVVLSTAVMTHNRSGRVDLTTILPFHKLGVSRDLTRALSVGRL